MYENTDEEEPVEYVVVFPRSTRTAERVLLVEKDRPSWQRGRLNLVGGRVEQGESAEDAAVRELAEESGLGTLGHPLHVGTIEAAQCCIYVVEVMVSPNQKLNPRPEETERVFWAYWGDVRQDRRLIPNLRTIIPLCMAGESGWSVRDVGNRNGAGPYTIEVSF